MDQVSDEIKKVLNLYKGVNHHKGVGIKISFTVSGSRKHKVLDGLTLTKNNIIAASQKLAAITHDINNDRFVWANHFNDTSKVVTSDGVKDVPTVKAIVDRVLNDKAITCTPKTHQIYVNKTNRNIYTYFENFKMNNITVSMLEEWILHDLHHLKAHTINEICTPFRKAFSILMKDRVIDFNPFDHIPRLKDEELDEDEKEDNCDPFERDEINTIINHPTSYQSEINAIAFACWSGLRISEWLSLAWEDVDLTKRQVKVRRSVVDGHYGATKNNGSFRTVDLIEPAYQAILRQKSISFMLKPVEVLVRTRDNKRIKSQKLSFVFQDTKKGCAWVKSNEFNEKFFKRHLKACGIRDRGANQCRHTFASHALTSGYSERIIAKMMGHSSLLMLEKHYAKIMQKDIENIGSALGRAMGFESSKKVRKQG